MKNDAMEEAGRGPSVWDFVEHDKDLGLYFKCKGRSHWQTHSSYWVQKDGKTKDRRPIKRSLFE